MTPNDSRPAGAAPDRLRVIGLMSGTSADGVDAALIETDGEALVRPLAALTLPYSPNLSRAILGAMGRMPDTEDAAVIEALTDSHAEAVAALLQRAGLTAAEIDLIGFHGQTLLHAPERQLTVQVGDAARLAAATGIDVVHDFRSADIASGGQGAPLVPVFHRALVAGLAPQPGAPVAVLNLGGVGNVTWVAPDGALLAFDTGPGNGPIDDWVRRHGAGERDEGGALGLAGRVDQAALHRLLALPFFDRAPPKALDRSGFAGAIEEALAGLSLQDGAATLAGFAASAVAAGQRFFPAPATRWLIAGGGRHNRALMAALAERLEAPAEAVEAVGWDGDALEAEAFGFLAVRSLRRLPLTYPTTTGVDRPAPGGRYHPAPPALPARPHATASKAAAE